MATATQTAIKERPIIFGAESVRAILEGRKTQTRRVIKGFAEERLYWNVPVLVDSQSGIVCCPYGKPGDRLWVREAFCAVRDAEPAHASDEGVTADNYGVVAYRESTRPNDGGFRLGDQVFGWRSPIHMPRWASRLTLEITNVRAERLQRITDADAEAEGCENPTCASISIAPGFMREVYRGAWDYLNAKRGFGWDTNPWVWVIEFRKVEPAT